MAKLEELNEGCVVGGILPRGTVSVIASPWHGSDCREIVYRTARGEIGTRILAIVEVDGGETNTVYIRHPFEKKPDPSACSVNYEIADLMRRGVIETQAER